MMSHSMATVCWVLVLLLKGTYAGAAQVGPVTHISSRQPSADATTTPIPMQMEGAVAAESRSGHSHSVSDEESEAAASLHSSPVLREYGRGSPVASLAATPDKQVPAPGSRGSSSGRGRSKRNSKPDSDNQQGPQDNPESTTSSKTTSLSTTTTTPPTSCPLGTNREPVFVAHPCGCRCVPKPPQPAASASSGEEPELTLPQKELFQEIAELLVNKNSTSKCVRQKISADDRRESSRVAGWLAVVVLGTVAAIIVLPDALRLLAALNHRLQGRKVKVAVEL